MLIRLKDKKNIPYAIKTLESLSIISKAGHEYRNEILALESLEVSPLFKGYLASSNFALDICISPIEYENIIKEIFT